MHHSTLGSMRPLSMPGDKVVVCLRHVSTDQAKSGRRTAAQARACYLLTLVRQVLTCAATPQPIDVAKHMQEQTRQ